jgi:hypothetical protein
LKNIRLDACSRFRNKKKACLKTKIEELETNSKNNNIWEIYMGINDVKKGILNNVELHE